MDLYYKILNLFRWILFLPAFVITETYAEYLCKNLIIYLYNNIVDVPILIFIFFFSAWLGGIVITLVAFVMVIIVLMQICPNQNIGAILCLITYLIMLVFYLSVGYLGTSIKDIIFIIIFSGACILTLIAPLLGNEKEK